jgi:hypothetical protein
LVVKLKNVEKQLVMMTTGSREGWRLKEHEAEFPRDLVDGNVS